MLENDRVPIAIINSPKDFAIARDEHWYRVPVESAEKGGALAARLGGVLPNKGLWGGSIQHKLLWAGVGHTEGISLGAFPRRAC